MMSNAPSARVHRPPRRTESSRFRRRRGKTSPAARSLLEQDVRRTSPRLADRRRSEHEARPIKNLPCLVFWQGLPA